MGKVTRRVKENPPPPSRQPHEPKAKAKAKSEWWSKWASFATIGGTALGLIGLWWTWYSFNQTFVQDRTKTALGFYSDYEKFVRDLESEPAKNEKAIVQCRRTELVPQTPARIKLIGYVAPASLDSRCGIPVKKEGAASTPESMPVVPPDSSASDVEPYTMPPMTINSISYAMHLAESILTIQPDEPGWQDTVAVMVCDNAASIFHANPWTCTAMSDAFVQHAKKYSLLCCKDETAADGSAPMCRQREEQAMATTAAEALKRKSARR